MEFNRHIEAAKQFKYHSGNDEHIGRSGMKLSALETNMQLTYLNRGDAEIACDIPRSFRGPRIKSAGFRVS